MRRISCLMLVVLMVVGLFSGCRSTGEAAGTQSEFPTEGSGTTADPTQPDVTTQPTKETEEEKQPNASVGLPGDDGTALEMGQTGKLRIPFTTIRSGVRYITDPSQLPDYPELEAYDEAFFRDHALVLVTETVTSGSVKVEIRSVVAEGGVARVTLDHQIPSGMNTADMTTWLLWVEVDAGLELTWELANPAMKPQDDKNQMY